MLVQDLSGVGGARIEVSVSDPKLNTTASKSVDLDHLRAFAVPPGWYDLDLCVGLYAMCGTGSDEFTLSLSGPSIGLYPLGGA